MESMDIISKNNFQGVGKHGKAWVSTEDMVMHSFQGSSFHGKAWKAWML